MPEHPTVGIAILTLNAEKHLPHCLPPLLASSLMPRILVVDSSSIDNTVKIAKEMGVETLTIKQTDFNHGTTREAARKQLATDIVVMLTQDAYALNGSMLNKLIQPIVKGIAAVSYARQIPHEKAGFFASFARSFNYPDTSQLRRLSDIETYGAYTFFCSDSCAAYSNSALDEIGGFSPVLFGEDTVAVAKLLHRDYAIAYVAEAVVRHSHEYTLLEEFRRHFDIGMSRKEHALLLNTSQDSVRGRQYVAQMCQHLWKKHPFLLPYAFVQTAIKWSGYRFGQMSLQAPVWLKKMFSSQKFYWSSKAFLQKPKG
jgi:rhamnosyltransferase